MKDNGHFDDITTREPGHLDGHDPAWQEYEDWLDSRDREEMDEATGFDAAFIAVSPAHYLHGGNLPIPEECQPSGETQIYTDYGFMVMRTDDVEARVRAAHDGWARDYGYSYEQTRAYVREYIRRTVETAMNPETWCSMADDAAKRAARRAA